MFKVGDKVKVNIKNCHNRIESIDEDVIGEVVHIDNSYHEKILQVKVYNKNLSGASGHGSIKLEKYEGGWWYEKDAVLIKTHFPLYSEEEAVKFLTEKGYTVTPPPEPLKGKIVIYDSCIGTTSCSYEQWNKYNNKKDCRLIAIVNWTEGQGI